eukprot:TRINITY_DN102054_c0_g1_i1.p1 TRINITY_DN102054_c0_g1~~TRINITY_DN102054_c0_g1_i1.p1  ORF type:complete len:468 (-),score=66.83 TRINITY_DN102054_c0_g1_i1:17-1420(-)
MNVLQASKDAIGRCHFLLWAAALLLSWSGTSQELDECVANLPECLAVLQATNQTGGAKDEEELAFSLLGSWMKELYTRKDPPRLAEDRDLRRSTLQRLRDLGTLSLTDPARLSLAIGVGQMLFLYFWWGLDPPSVGGSRSGAPGRRSGPDLGVATLAAELHEASIRSVGCDSSETSRVTFEAKKCPWRWRFVLLLLVEIGQQSAALMNIAVSASSLRRAEQSVVSMRALPYFSRHSSLQQGASRSNQNDDLFPGASHLPVWPREMWPEFAHFLEANAHIFQAELLRIVAADEEFDEVFHTVQEQQTEFTQLPTDWGLLDLVRQGQPTAACPYAPQSCALLGERPEINSHCFSERVPNAGIAFARLLPGTEIKPHFATEPRLAVHLGLVTPPGPKMFVANETVTWTERRAVVFDDTYTHSVRHEGSEARYVLLAWTCHPCDPHWRAANGEAWQEANPLPGYCSPSQAS